MAQIHKSHKGELLLQERLNTPQLIVDGLPHFIDRDMPPQHADFFAGLSYLPLATLDNQGRPWISLLVTTADNDPSIGIKVEGKNTMDVVAQTSPFDPFARALQQQPTSPGEERLFAGVGVDFSNRRRNKLAGSIGTASVEQAGKLRLRLNSDQHLGNCPKYITVRTLVPAQRKAELSYDSFDTSTSALPADAKAVVDRASTVFLATKHSAKDKASGVQTDMGVNHRGGAPGFTRVYEEEDGDGVATYLVLPDHSGNRFYQTLGNIETDPQVGLVFPDFANGHVLYVTGEAENLLNADAEALMPRTNLLTRIKVTGAVLVNNGLNLRLTSEEQLSPYNPPVKYLQQELDEMGHAIATQDGLTAITATLASTQDLSESIKTFNFELSSPIDAPMPGGFGVFDFSKILDTGYSHMNEANPKLVNEDYVRTWTISSAPDFDAESRSFRAGNRVSVTVKRKPGGLMSNVMHDNADKLIAQKIPVDFKGTGAGFTCFSPDSEGGPPAVPTRMLWVAGGVGITPFMPMWDGIKKVAIAVPGHLSTDIVLVFAGRDDDINVVRHFISQSSAIPSGVSLNVLAFQSAREQAENSLSTFDDLSQNLSDGGLTLEQRRLQIDDLRNVADLQDREVFMCGPDSLMDWSDEALTKLKVAETRRHRESFIF
ncbi:pyridoxamine 5'-phosphate oxidase family protein [Cognatishimia maritima]|uniref:Ferredoxin-NADP reductase n=1 Tax=Cognatishimia maritima TaxID=870908 RepID=A0A1M5Q6W8_9RHOB|nr:pyridoxamine 5'-phosphate oxidase family protein [Cognatishimia maritima]SHH09646.1 Ferredoxin-NADP reductase [Cognatishimia maritima]